MSHTEEMMGLIEREIKPIMMQRDLHLDYGIKLQKLIEALIRGDDPLPFPDLHHSRRLTQWRESQAKSECGTPRGEAGDRAGPPVSPHTAKPGADDGK